MARVYCSHCGYEAELSDSFAGQWMPCPECKKACQCVAVAQITEPGDAKRRLRKLPRSDPRAYVAGPPGHVDVSSFTRLLKWASLLVLLAAAGVAIVGLPANQILNTADIRNWRDSVQNQEMVFKNANRVHVDYEQMLKDSAIQAGLMPDPDGRFIERFDLVSEAQGQGLTRKPGYRVVQAAATVNVQQTLLKCYTTRSSISVRHSIYVPAGYEIPSHTGAKVVWQRITEACLAFGRAGGTATFGGVTLAVPEGALPENTNVVIQCGVVDEAEDTHELLWVKLRTDPPARFAKAATLSAPGRTIALESVVAEPKLFVKSAAFRLDRTQAVDLQPKDAVVFASPQPATLQLAGKPGTLWFRHTSLSDRVRKWVPTEVRWAADPVDDKAAAHLEANAIDPGIKVILTGDAVAIPEDGLAVRDGLGAVLGLVTGKRFFAHGAAPATGAATPDLDGVAGGTSLFVPVRIRQPGKTGSVAVYASPGWSRATTKGDVPGIEIGTTDGMASTTTSDLWCRAGAVVDPTGIVPVSSAALPNSRADIATTGDALAKLADKTASAGRDVLPNVSLSATIVWQVREDGTYMAGW